MIYWPWIRSRTLPSAVSHSTTSLSDWLGPLAHGSAVAIRDIHMDSRSVGRGDAFIAVAGEQGHGHDYVAKAIAQGAAAVLVEDDGHQHELGELGVPVIALEGLKQQLGSLAKRFYGNASPGQLKVIGITGTNGKTSVSHMLAQLLADLGQRCAVVGTLGWGFTDDLLDTGMTTPDVVSMHRILARLVAAEARFVAMEVSSHGLAQGRTDQVDFTAAIFTNLTRDHLDYHGDIASYGASKRSLFLQPMVQAVFNVDDTFGAQLYRDPELTCNKLSYSLNHAVADVFCSQLQFHSGGATALLETPWGQGQLHCPLMGPFNLLNILSCIALLGGLGFELSALLRSATRIDSAPGRMQLVHDGEVKVIVDFAHTPDALQQVLQALRPHVSGQLSLVFGCGGDRDKGKRPLMAELAGRLADKVIVTSDNPRSESPQDIIDDICAGFDAAAEFDIEVDRALAIEQAIAGAAPGDMVVIAGKGHENYQEINGERRPFNDLLCVEQCFRALQQAGR
jgi:UDP-N-acetylmuramoyl-L-alanyl-D-glutamate--2,6-diaminopimelate ligase